MNLSEAKAQLDEGNLSAAITAALGSVKANPAATSERTFLFELSCFSGDWDRADKQLDVLGHQESKSAMGSIIYRQALSAERDRTHFFEKGGRPETPGKPPEYVEELFAANDLIRKGELAAGRELLDKVEEDRPAFPCVVNGKEYPDLRDYNELTACVFEAIIKDSYVWIPFEDLVTLEFTDRVSLRDVFWRQVQFELKNGTNGEMFIPSLYVNSWKSSDDQVRLGRSVDWRDAGSDIFLGEGSRLYSLGDENLSIHDFKTLEFR